jgi:hypothetical protein
VEKNIFRQFQPTVYTAWLGQKHTVRVLLST